MPLVKKTEPLPWDIYYQTEVWQPAPFGFWDYQVSCYGNVRSLKKGSPVLLKQSRDSDGYPVVGLFKDNKQTKFKAHRLLAIVYIPNPDNLPVVNHLDHVRDHNFIWNVEWTTERENTSHAFLNKDTSSTYTGVCLDKRKITKPWGAAIHLLGKQKFLGYYETEEQAGTAYKNALKENQIVNKYLN